MYGEGLQGMRLLPRGFLPSTAAQLGDLLPCAEPVQRCLWSNGTKDQTPPIYPLSVCAAPRSSSRRICHALCRAVVTAARRAAGARKGRSARAAAAEHRARLMPSQCCPPELPAAVRGRTFTRMELWQGRLNRQSLDFRI